MVYARVVSLALVSAHVTKDGQGPRVMYAVDTITPAPVAQNALLVGTRPLRVLSAYSTMTSQSHVQHAVRSGTSRATVLCA